MSNQNSESNNGNGFIDEHKPYVPHDQSVAEFSFRALFLGIIFGVIFGIATVYLGLKIGLTVSASIPIAVLSVSIFKKIGGSTILENNIVQTIGSAGESIAAGVVFTVPALFLMKFQVEYSTIFIISIIGGILGVFFMIPLRRYLIVKEHKTLPYPEGTACADVLIAGEKGGSLAKLVFAGLGIGTLYKFMMNVFNFWKDTPAYAVKAFKGAIFSGEISPELLGVGYIIGPRISGIMVAGGILSAFVFTPLIKIFGENLTTIIPPASVPISQMSMDDIWSNYIRYIGGGAVVFGGLVTMLKTLPTIWTSFAASFRELFTKVPHALKIRTERDIPLYVTLIGALVLVGIISFMPFMPGHALAKFVTAFLMVFFGFFFVTVSSRIVGLIGSSSNPISGMTITTIMLTCLLFVAVGWTGKAYAVTALCVGAVVCIAAANGGATSQDLKTGYIVGSTPFWQQIGLVIGVITSSFAVGFTLIELNNSLTIGSAELAAPKAQLMSLIIDGVLNQTLPWDLILVGFFMGLVMEACGIEALPFAVGAYLPLSMSTPIMAGGFINWLANKIYGITAEEAETSPGVLYSSGLIAGSALTGIVIAIIKSVRWPVANFDLSFIQVLPGFSIPLFQNFSKDFKSLASYLDFNTMWQLEKLYGNYSDLVAVTFFGILSLTLLYMARKTHEE